MQISTKHRKPSARGVHLTTHGSSRGRGAVRRAVFCPSSVLGGLARLSRLQRAAPWSGITHSNRRARQNWSANHELLRALSSAEVLDPASLLGSKVTRDFEKNVARLRGDPKDEYAERDADCADAADPEGVEEVPHKGDEASIGRAGEAPIERGSEFPNY